LLEHLGNVLLDQEASHLRLQQSQQLENDGISELFELTQDTSLEQDLAQANPVGFSVQLDFVQDLKAGSLVISGSLDSGGSENAIASQELLVQQSGWIALAANTDTCMFVICILVIVTRIETSVVI